MNHFSSRIHTACLAVLAMCTATFAQNAPTDTVPENVYTAQALSYPGAWAYQLGKSGIIIVEDQQLDDLTDPDKPVDLGLTGTPDVKSLRQICEGAMAAGHRTLILALSLIHISEPTRPY